MKAYEREKNNPKQIIRKDGSDTFLEVLAPSDDFNKVTLNIIKYDKNQGNKMIDTNSFYFTIPEFLVICKKIEDYSLQRENEKEKNRVLTAGGNTLPNKLMLKQGGGIKDGVVEARAFYFQPATKAKYANILICLEKGRGIQQNNGLISMDYKSGTVSKLHVGVSYDDLMEIALMGRVRIEALITARTVRGNYDGVTIHKPKENTGFYPTIEEATLNPQPDQAVASAPTQNTPPTSTPANQNQVNNGAIVDPMPVDDYNAVPDEYYQNLINSLY